MKDINICRMDRGRWVFKEGGEQKAIELGAKLGKNVLRDSPALESITLLHWLYKG